MKVELRRTKLPWARQKWHFVVVANNGEIIVTSENYHNKQDALDTIQTLLSLRKNTPVEEVE